MGRLHPRLSSPRLRKRQKRGASVVDSLINARKKVPIQPYQYSALDMDGQRLQIRLFELLPGAKNEPLRGRIRTIDFGPEAEYDAVSYIWGDPTPRYPLMVDDNQVICIATNLRKALLGLRLPKLSRILWVDAICINQRDIEERGHQVSVMGTIYRRARIVRVWLDVEVDPRCKAMRMASRLMGPSTEGIFQASHHRELRCTVSLDDFGPEFWEPLRRVFESPYWLRVWTQQEHLLAQRLQFHSPGGHYEPEPLLRFYAAVNRSVSTMSGERWREYVGNVPPSLTFGDLPSTGRSGARDREHAPLARREFSLLLLFLGSGSLGSMDPRDHVFGFLGLSEDCPEKDGIEIDYRMPTSSAFQQVAQHYWHTYNSLAFLCIPARGSDHSLPSWLPSFTKDSVTFPMFPVDQPPDLESGSVSFRDDDILTVRGFQYQIIRRKDPPCMFQPVLRVLEWARAVGGMAVDDDHGVERLKHELFLALANAARRSDELYLGPSPAPKSSLGNLSQRLRDLLEFVRRHHPTSTFGDLIQLTPPLPEELLHPIRLLYLGTGWGSFVSTDAGRVGLCLNGCGLAACEPAQGDEVWVLFGCPLPLVLRPQYTRNRGSVVRKVYSHIGCLLSPGLIADACHGLLPDGSPGPSYQGSFPEDIDLV